ncbi:MAG: hypothetical protein IT436_05625 [Phycisphaerales bacterium]|nr:hypothetical protein [Phycisphaerales bacterium]
MLPRLILMLCLVVQPAMGWWRAGAASAERETTDSCCCLGMEAEPGAPTCEPGRGCAPAPGRAGCCTDVQRLLTSGPRVLRTTERDTDGRGPVDARARRIAHDLAGAGYSARPAAQRPAREIRSAMCVWVI